MLRGVLAFAACAAISALAAPRVAHAADCFEQYRWDPTYDSGSPSYSGEWVAEDPCVEMDWDLPGAPPSSYPAYNGPTPTEAGRRAAANVRPQFGRSSTAPASPVNQQHLAVLGFPTVVTQVGPSLVLDLAQDGIQFGLVNDANGRAVVTQHRVVLAPPSSRVGVTGVPNDRVPGGQGAEPPPTNNPQDGRAASDPVNPANGDFYIQRRDLRLPAKGLDIVLERVYHSRLSYDGPLGFGWASNFEQRLVAGTDKCSDEIRYHAGLGTVFVFEKVTETDTAVSYRPTGNPTKARLVGVKNGTTLKWRVLDLDGTIHYFDERGLLTRIEGSTGYGLDLAWEAAPGGAQFRIATVKDVSSRTVTFHYATDSGRLTSVTDSASDLSVHYGYNRWGELVDVTDALGRREYYGYQFTEGHDGAGEPVPYPVDQPTDSAQIPEGYLRASCELACAPSGTSCRSAGVCDGAAAEGHQICEDATQHCSRLCDNHCRDYVGRDYTSASDEIKLLCLSGVHMPDDLNGDDGCDYQCDSFCDDHDSVDTHRVEPYFTPMCQATWDGPGAPLSPHGWSDPHVACAMAAHPGIDPGLYEDNAGDLQCHDEFIKDCTVELIGHCRPACKAQCFGKCAEDSRVNCTAECKYGTDPDLLSCSQVATQCTAMNFEATCQDSCVDGCIKEGRGDGAPIFGHPVDLAHNIVHLYDGDHRMFVENGYGDDPALASFDAVKTQKIGEYTTEFHYRDLAAEKAGALSIPSSGPEALADSYDTFESVNLCPTFCILGPFQTGPVEYVPWNNDLVLIKGGRLGGFAGVPRASTAVPPTVLAFATVGGKARARALVGDEQLPADFSFSYRSDAGPLAFARDTSNAGYFAITGTDAAIAGFKALGEITLLTDRAGVLHVYAGRPLGLAEVASGSCTAPFQATRNASNQVDLSPTTACTTQLTVAPLATIVDGPGYASDFASGGSGAFSTIDLFAPSVMVPGRHTVELRAVPGIAGRYEQSIGARDGTAPSDLGKSAQAASAVPLFHAPPASAAATAPILTIFHVPAGWRASGDTSIYMDDIREFRPEPMTSSCIGAFVGDPIRGGTIGPKPEKATVVVDGYGAKTAFYYDEQGRSIRQQRLDPEVASVTSVNYNSTGDLAGYEGTFHDRTCLLYDNDGNVSEVRRDPIPSFADTPIRQRFQWRQSPTRLSTVYDPRDPTKVSVSYQYDAQGRLIGSTDGLGQHTTYVPQPWGAIHQVIGPDGTITEINADTNTGSEDETIVDAASGGLRLTTTTALDSAGRPQLTQSPLGTRVSYSWDGPQLQTSTFAATGLSSSTGYTYNGSGQLKTVNNGRAQATTTYDLMGQVESVTEHALDGSLADRVTCRKSGPDGRLLETVSPEGERTRYTYDLAGQLISVYSGKWARDPLGSWDDACVESLPGPNEFASGEVQHFWYDQAGRLLQMRDGAGIVHRYYSDGFGRVYIEEDALGNQHRIGYDAAGRPIWTASYAPVVGIPSYGPPQMTDVGLLAATKLLYDDNGRVVSLTRFHLGPNGEMLSDGSSVTVWTYDDLARKITVTDDAWHITASTYDRAGRLANVVYPTGGVANFTYANNGRTVTKQWTAPTTSGVHTQRSSLTEWGAPASTVQLLASGVEVPLAAWTYDAVGRPHTVTSAGGAVQTITPDAFGRTHTTATNLGSGTETVTIDYDRDDRAVRRRSWAASTAQAAETTYAYDALGRMTQLKRPGNILETYAYQATSPFLWKRVDARGITSTMTYTATGQLHDIVAGVATAPTSTWSRRSFDYDGLGRMTRAMDSGESYLADSDDVVTTMTWDSLGNKLTEASSVMGTSETIAATYDGLGQRVSEQLGPVAVTRAYDAIGRESDIWLSGSTATEAHFTYAGLGAATARTLKNGVQTTYGYDELERLAQLEDKRGTTSLDSWAWKVPADGAPRTATFTRTGATSPISSVFQVDAGGRLLSEDHGVTSSRVALSAIAPSTTTTAANAAVALFLRTGLGLGTGGYGSGTAGTAWRDYSLDGRANWLQRTAGLASLSVTTVLNLLDGYTSFGSQAPTYNADGSLATAGATESYAYNNWGEVSRVVIGATRKQYTYDGLGRRVAETTTIGSGTASAPTKYLYDGLRRVLRLAPGQTTPEVMVDGQGLDEHIVRVASDSTRTYYHQGRDRSVYLVTNAVGSSAEWYQYTAYGEMTMLSAAGTQVIATSAIGNRFGYQGQVFDSTTGLVDMRARFYRPQWGRFVTLDPSGLAGGPNLYAFVGARPLSGWDPLGLSDNRAYGGAGGSSYGPHYDAEGAGVDDLIPGQYCDDNDCSENTAIGQVFYWGSGTIAQTGLMMNTTGELITLLPRVGINGVGDTLAWVDDKLCSGPGCVAMNMQASGVTPEMMAGAAYSSFEYGVLSMRSPLFSSVVDVEDSAVFLEGPTVINIDQSARIPAGDASAVAEAGAGGNWATINERPGGAVAQSTPVSCGPACGEMLTGQPQADLILTAGAPTDPFALARALGEGWRGGYVGEEQLDAVVRLGRPWAAELYDGGSLAHLVVVEAVEGGNFMIRDPWKGGSTYAMAWEEFLRVWTGRAVFR